MTDVSRLIKAMKKASTPSQNDIVDIVTGVVTSIDPLKIKIDKIELTESFLILSALCKETKIKIPTSTESAHIHIVPSHTTESATVGEYGSHTHTIAELNTEFALPEITLWRGLKVDDKVYMLKCCRGQKYYVLQRMEGIK